MVNLVHLMILLLLSTDGTLVNVLSLATGSSAINDSLDRMNCNVIEELTQEISDSRYELIAFEIQQV